MSQDHIFNISAVLNKTAFPYGNRLNSIAKGNNMKKVAWAKGLIYLFRVKPSEKILKKHKSITSVKLIKNANDFS